MAREGRVVVIPKDAEQRGKIAQGLKKLEGVETRAGRSAEPLVVVSGVIKGMTDDDLIGKLKRGKEELKDIGEGRVRVIRRIACRNPWKENVILAMGLENFKGVVKRGKVEIDCELHFAEEYLGVAMCFRCCRFGHVAKFYNEKEVCYRCLGAHAGNKCKEKEKTCVNCFIMYGGRANHGARDSVCPAFQAAVERSRKQINYV